MRKINTCLVLILLFTVSLVGCLSDDEEEQEQQEEGDVVTGEERRGQGWSRKKKKIGRVLFPVPFLISISRAINFQLVNSS